ncbi:MAG TPA: NADH-quinone oxidoreductase subunit NuoG [Gammaproteobacteria bacterium]
MPIYVDNREYPAAPEKNLLEHCLALGFDLPYFCWHPAMGSVGACRQCAVKQYRDENDTHGRIVMACMTPATDGTRIGLDEPEARDFRARVIEWLMVNHPHDCPVCEEGGECHLQDMTVMTGHNYRRYRGLKRTHRNQYLGPFLNHEMNRCIACYRCVRFYQDVAGGDDLRAFATHHHVYFGRHEDGVLESEWSGNLAEVCPTGVFTDKPFSDHYVRKWDLQSAPSICPHCSVGCNISAQERYGRLRRIVNRYNGDVNGYFICDRGRFGYGYVNGAARVRAPLARTGRGALEPVAAEAALARAVEMLAGRVIGIGSPRASLEANFALQRLVGADNFYVGVPAADARLLSTVASIRNDGATRVPSIADAAAADAVLVLGEDVPNTAPRLALALREAARQRQKAIAAALEIPAWLDQPVRTAGLDQWSPLFVATADATRLDGIAERTHRAPPDEIARLGFAIARRIDPSAPDVAELSPDAAALAEHIAAALADAGHPLVVSGTGAGDVAVIEAAANVALALGAKRGRAVDLALVVPECNSLGLALLGGRNLDDALERADAQPIRAAVVLENDLERRLSRSALDRLRARLEHLIVVDHTLHGTARAADLVLPAAAFAEGDGTLSSSEGRAQRFYQVYVPEGDIRESWRWLAEMIRRRGERCTWQTLDDVTTECAESVAPLARITAAAPGATFRIVGKPIARESARYSGRTAMRANVEIRERKPPPDPDAPLAFSMEGYYGTRTPPALMPYHWAPGWNSNQQSVQKFKDETGRLRGGNPGVRLFEPSDGAARRYFDGVPPPSDRAEDAFRVVPLYHVFGSDELSAASPPIAERVPEPYVAVSADDAHARGLDAGRIVEVALGDALVTLPIRVSPTLAPGVIGVPRGLPGLPVMAGRVARIRPAAAGDRRDGGDHA